jgi:hypothetical protein
MRTEERAAVEAAARRLKRAAGLLRQATQELAALEDGLTVLGVSYVHDRATADSVRNLIDLSVGRHGGVDVIVIARPRRAHSPRPERAKEERNGTRQAAAAQG